MGIFDVFKKKKSASSTNKTAIVNLANDIHKKFHATCDVLEKIKPNVGREGLIKLLNLKGVSEDKHSTNLWKWRKRTFFSRIQYNRIFLWQIFKRET